MDKSVGYLYLIERFGLDVCDLLHKSCLTERSQKEVVISSDYKKILYPDSRYQVADTWQDNLVFALKHEGINLEVLKAFFQKVSPEDIVKFVNGAATRFAAKSDC